MRPIALALAGPERSEGPRPRAWGVRALGYSLLAVCIAAGAGGCDPQLYDKAERRREARAEDEARREAKEEPAPRSPAMNPFAALAALSAGQQTGPFDEPRRSPSAKSGAPYAAVLDLRGRVVELDAPFSFSLDLLRGGGGSLGLRQVIERLTKLAATPEVSAIVLRLGDLSLSMALAEELRAAIVAIDKPVHCHAEALDNTGMLLASACRSIGLAPAGVVAMPGPSIVPLYLRGLLDLVGVEADFVHIGAYKGAAEPLTLRAPSKEMRETYGDLVDGAYQRLLEQVSAGRKVPREKVAAWIDRALFLAEAARSEGLVDEVATFEQFRDARSPGGAWGKEPWKPGAGGMQDLLGMLGMQPRARVRGPHLALLYAVGEVVQGRGGSASAYSEISSYRLAPALRAAAADPDVKAVVLRVDSPGGSAQASELIYRAVREAAQVKPVIVSMGSLAASGGYYIAAGASRIYAQPDTLTGSIGVVGGKLVLAGAATKLGITAAEIARGRRALIASPLHAWSDDERAAVLALMEDVYATFKARVAEGRKLDAATVEKHAQGRVFTGFEAKRRGLVDEIGGLAEAIAAARDAGKLPRDAPIEVYPGEPTLLDLVGGLTGAHAATALEAALRGPLAAAAPLLGARAAETAADILSLAASFSAEPVRAVSFLPSVR